MNNQKINGAVLRDLFLGGAANLEKNKSYIDSLNVFPVPDGDTGTNMHMTMQGAVKEIHSLADDVPLSKVMDSVSNGALRSARGNSGVILSQLFRGYALACKGKTEMDAALFAQALENGSQSAYKAVMRPKEGTILTVARLMAQACVQKVAVQPAISFADILAYAIEQGNIALEKTPELLPVLKEAGVVDSGGMGLLTVFRGMMAVLLGEELPESYQDLPKEQETESTEDFGEGANLDHFSTEDIEFGYCSEFFIVRLKEGFSDADLDRLRDHYVRVGDSLVLASGDDFVKVHVHSNCPGKILAFAMQFGELDKIKIENMREQNRQLLEARKRNEKEYGIVAVSVGEGIDAIFRNFAVDQLISGGQTMNPSIDTIVNTVRHCNARNVFVLPNNSNIILAAEQAKELCECNVIVLPTKTIPQGISAAMAFNGELSLEDNVENMKDAISEVVSGSVTFAVRETHYNGIDIHEGDIIGMMDNDICTVEQSTDAAVRSLLKQMIAKRGLEDPIINLYYGESVSEEECNDLADALSQEYPDAEFLVAPGGQPLYYYYLSVE